MVLSTQRVVYFFILLLASLNAAAVSLKDQPATATDTTKSKMEPHSLADEKRLLKRFANIKTVTAEFTQKLYTSESNKPQITYGTLQVAGGDKFRLEYTKPYKQLYIANGKEFLFYDVDLEQISIKPQSKELADTPAMILSNPVIFIKNYFVRLNNDSRLEEYILTAKSDTAAYDKILLSFKNTRLTTMLIEDSFGQETELDFTKMRYNKKIPDSVFNFTPPEGVDIIRSTPKNKSLPSHSQQDKTPEN